MLASGNVDEVDGRAGALEELKGEVAADAASGAGKFEFRQRWGSRQDSGGNTPCRVLPPTTGTELRRGPTHLRDQPTRSRPANVAVVGERGCLGGVSQSLPERVQQASDGAGR